MTVVLEKLTDVQGQVVDLLAQAKEPVTTGVSAVVDFVSERVPNVPAIPFAEQIPTPKEVIDNQYRFAKQLIDTQKDIALAIAKAAAPLTDKVLDRKAPVRKAAAKVAAKPARTA
jgi:hypothetical protein